VAPVSALVAKDGKYVVTFDNWHSMGHGDNVVVIYGPIGELVKKLGLSDFIDGALLWRLPISVSSIWWGHGHELDEKAGVVVVKVGNHDRMGMNGKPIQAREVRLRLKDGRILGPMAGEGPMSRKP
jgi:hypothetical protein